MFTCICFRTIDSTSSCYVMQKLPENAFVARAIYFVYVLGDVASGGREHIGFTSIKCSHETHLRSPSSVGYYLYCRVGFWGGHPDGQPSISSWLLILRLGYALRQLE
jgi:hypothetical protein